MSDDEIMAKVTEIIQDIFENLDMSVTPETTAVMVPGWDSAAQIKLLLAVEEEFSIHFSAREMDQLRHVGDLIAAISRQLGPTQK
jgi:acyl carrier protein